MVSVQTEQIYYLVNAGDMKELRYNEKTQAYETRWQ